jgi:putative acetyltransferase
LLAERDAHFAALYPDRDTTLLPLASLASPEVTFLEVRHHGHLAGCGALIARGRVGELKRFYVRASLRGQGLGAILLAAAEAEARRLGVWLIRLEVGRLQRHAIALYRRAGYRPIRYFSPYRPDPVCLFRAKRIKPNFQRLAHTAGACGRAPPDGGPISAS